MTTVTISKQEYNQLIESSVALERVCREAADTWGREWSDLVNGRKATEHIHKSYLFLKYVEKLDAWLHLSVYEEKIYNIDLSRKNDFDYLMSLKERLCDEGIRTKIIETRTRVFG